MTARAPQGVLRGLGVLPVVAVALILVLVLPGPVLGAPVGPPAAGAVGPATGPAAPAPNFQPIHAASGSPVPFASGRGPLEPFRPLPRAGGVPAAGGDLANPTVATFSLGAVVDAVGPSNQTVLVGVTNETYLADFLDTGDLGLFARGLSSVVRTNDGGASWSTAWIANNASWSNSASLAYGDVSWGADAIAGSNGDAVYATTYAAPCAVLQLNSCNSSAEYAAPSGVAVATSTDGGASWSAAIPVSTAAEWGLQGIVCANTSYFYYIPANITDKPSVALSADGQVAVVAWDLLDYYDRLICAGGQVGLQVTAEYDLTQVAVSTDGGQSWGPTTTLGSGVSGPASVAIGPAPTDAITVVFDDPENGTATTFPFAASVSTDGGASWGAPSDVGSPTMVRPVTSSAPDSWSVATVPDVAADANASSPYAGQLYLTWDQNRSIGSGDPSVALAVGSPAGGWSGTRYLSAPGGYEQFYEPTVSVAPDGTVWDVYYAEDVYTGAYQLVGQLSTDGGATWGVPFAIADAASPDPPVTFIGYWVGAAANSAGLFSAWTDCRSAACETGGITDVAVARSAPVTLSSNVSGVALNATSGGWSDNASAPFTTAWTVNAAVSVSAPSWLTLANTTDYVAVFDEFSGAVVATEDPVGFDFEGGAGVAALYAYTPAGWIAGTVSPSSASVNLTVDGSPVRLGAPSAGAYPFNVSVEPDAVYNVSATAPGYQPFSKVVPVQIGGTTRIPISLVRSPSWIAGRVVPFSASVEVNGTPIPVSPTTGLYNQTVSWGSYWVNATSPGRTRFSDYVTVGAGQTTTVSATLIGGWIAGSIAPAGATLTIDGADVATAMGAFNVSVLGGRHTLAVSSPGYSSYATNVTVAPGATSYVPVTLSDVGWISGAVRPVTAEVVIHGTLVPLVAGRFNVSEIGFATYNVTVEEAGYATQWGAVEVTPVATSFVNVSLALAPAACAPLCPATTPSSATGASPAYSVTDAVVATLLILGAAVVGAVLLLVFRPRPPPTRPSKEIYAAPGSAAPTLARPPPPGGAA